ncbi:MAG: pilus assembly protein TadG-related protein [Pseudomonadota bacterium]
MSSRSGNFALMTALLSVPVLAGVAMTVEYSNLSDNRSRLQNAVDAAALYVGKYSLEHDELPSKRDVRTFVIKNFDGKVSSVQIKGRGKNSDEYSVYATSKAPQFFFGGVAPGVYNQSAEAMVPKAGFSSMAVALVLDTTGSMQTHGKIASLRNEASKFIDDMREASARSDVRIGIVPFDYHVNVGTSNRYEPWVDAGPSGSNWNGCVGSRPSPYTFRDTAPNVRFEGMLNFTCSNPITPLTDDWVELKKEIKSLKAKGATYAAVGVMWGLRVLSEEEPFNEVKALDSPVRIMVVMADGDNTRSHDLANNSAGNWSRDGVAGDANTKAACNEAKAKGVTVYTIAFGKTISTRGQDVLRNCASEGANYFLAKDAAGLKDAFENIAEELTRLRLTG